MNPDPILIVTHGGRLVSLEFSGPEDRFTAAEFCDFIRRAGDAIDGGWEVDRPMKFCGLLAMKEMEPENGPSEMALLSTVSVMWHPFKWGP